MKPLVSIIIPVHNAADFLVETIESCFNQSYTNIEMVAVENGSSDNSWDILNNYSKGRLRLFQLAKGNAAAARNFGFQKSEGDLICFLDADDLLDPNKIELQVRGLLNQDRILSCGPWGKFITAKKEAKFVEQPVWRVTQPLDWLISSWFGGGMMVPGCWLIPRQVVELAGLWNEKLSLHDDGEFMSRVLLNSKSIKFEEDAKLYYRQSEGSLSQQNTSKRAAESALAVYKLYAQHVLKIGNTKTVKEALARNFGRFMYEYSPEYPQLLQEAKAQIVKLGVKIPPLGSQSFQITQRIFGFHSALTILNFNRRHKN